MVNNNYLELKIRKTEKSIDEAIKVIRTNLLYSGDIKSVVVTSVRPNEGKSTVSFLLAESFAELNKKVVYIDCDLRKSVFSSRYGTSHNLLGLSEYLSGQSDMNIYDTNIKNLYIIPTGKIPPNPVELLSKGKFKNLIDALKDTFDYVIIDGAPVGSVIDSSIVGREVDGTVLVVRNNFTKKHALRKAKEQVVRNGGNVVGVVLNRVTKHQKDYYYDSYYGE